MSVTLSLRCVKPFRHVGSLTRNPLHRRKCQTWNCRERGPPPPLTRAICSRAIGTVDVGPSPPTCVACNVPLVWRSAWPQAAAAGAEQSQASVCAKILCNCGGGGGREVPMVEDGPDDAPSEAEREKLRTLLANFDASIAALTTVARGDEDVHQILKAKQEKREQVQASMSGHPRKPRR